MQHRYRPDKISLAKLPSTSSDLFGREKELKELDDAWNNPAHQRDDSRRVGRSGEECAGQQMAVANERGQLSRSGAGVRLVVLQPGRGGGTAGIC